VIVRVTSARRPILEVPAVLQREVYDMRAASLALSRREHITVSQPPGPRRSHLADITNQSPVGLVPDINDEAHPVGHKP
jgi:hypothetical protein